MALKEVLFLSRRKRWWLVKGDIGPAGVAVVLHQACRALCIVLAACLRKDRWASGCAPGPPPKRTIWDRFG